MLTVLGRPAREGADSPIFAVHSQVWYDHDPFRCILWQDGDTVWARINAAHADAYDHAVYHASCPIEHLAIRCRTDRACGFPGWAEVDRQRQRGHG